MPFRIPEHIEIRDVAGNAVAFLSPDTDGLKECWVDIELNHSSTLTFSLPKQSAKWAYISSNFRIIANGREYAILNPDAITDTRDGKKLFGKVSANECWNLLRKEFVTVSNDPASANPPWSAVIILSGGVAAGGYAQGSAGSAFTYLLQGTEWSVGVVDVSGTHDLENEKESILANINKVQEIWGGILLWDSLNKTVSLRDESLWQEYKGFQIRYAKNLKHIERTIDNDIVTRLYPFGADDLDISTVNGGELYLENFQSANNIYEDIYTNQDITTPQELKDKGTEVLDKLSKPRNNYRVEMVDIRSLPEWNHEDLSVGDMADVIDDDVGIDARARIIRHKYNVFQPWLCELEIGDPIEKLDSILSDSRNAAEYIKRILRPNAGVGNILKGIINTLATEINDSRGSYTLVDGVSTWFERDIEGELTGSLLRITPEGLIISSDGGQTWELAISGSGGVNASVMRTGLLSASVVQVGADTTFESGYDPTLISPDKVNPYFEKDLKCWSASYSGENPNELTLGSIISGVGSWGSKVWEHTGDRRIFYREAIPINTSKAYKGRFKVRQTVNSSVAGTSRTYAGVVCLDANYQYIIYRWFIANSQTITVANGWKIFDGIISGEGTAINTFPAGTKYVRPVFLINYQSGDGTAQADGLEFFDVTEANDAQNNLDSHSGLQSPHNLPSYCKMQSDGFKVFDSSDNLRCHMGQYVAGKYGIKIIDGEIYATTFQSGAEGATDYVQIGSGWQPVRIVKDDVEQLIIFSDNIWGAFIEWSHPDYGRMGLINTFNDALGRGLRLSAEDNYTAGRTLLLDANFVQTNSSYVYLDYYMGDVDVTVWGNFYVTDYKDCMVETVNYGTRFLTARESPEVKFIDEGKAQLTQGQCRINIDPIFIDCVEPDTITTPWLIQLTPYADINIYVAEIGVNYIIVQERTGGTSDVPFAWSLSAFRKGFTERFRTRDEDDLLTSDWEDTITEGI